uniref:Fatty acid synthase-like n=1 Tax=Diabrotica virgifera virgifera TaxID=50390 RepID=A0A6P7GIJ8_DIAVI
MKAATTMSLLHMVASILGVETIDSIDKTTTLMQLGMDSLMTLEIKQTLYRVCQISLGIDSIGLLTFELLSTYEQNKTAKE